MVRLAAKYLPQL